MEAESDPTSRKHPYFFFFMNMLVSNLRPECLDLFPHKWLLQAAYYCTKVVTPQENIGEIKQELRQNQEAH